MRKNQSLRRLFLSIEERSAICIEGEKGVIRGEVFVVG